MIFKSPLQRFLPLLFAAMILTAGCATVESPPVSGFLEDYEGFVPDPEDESLLWWEQEGFDWSDYRAVILEPISIYYHSEAQGREILPDELKKLTDAFQQSIIAELGEDYPIVDEPAPDVLRIHGAITDVIPTNAAVNVVTSIVALVPVDMGGAAIEVEFLDSVTNERLAAGVDQKLGTPLDGISGFTRLGHARSAFREWAKELHVALESNP